MIRCTRRPAIYIMASQPNGTLYIGVTSDLVQRVWQHRTSTSAGFASRYNCKMLVYYELHADMREAIAREKQIKGGSRKEARSDRGQQSDLAGSVRGERLIWRARNDGSYTSVP